MWGHKGTPDALFDMSAALSQSLCLSRGGSIVLFDQRVPQLGLYVLMKLLVVLVVYLFLMPWEVQGHARKLF